MKLYIAGPMTGVPEYNYPAFERAKIQLHKRGYEVLCPTAIAADRTHSWSWRMRQSLAQVLQADAIAVLPNAACSKGALLELTVARALEMRVLPIAQWIGMEEDE